MGRRKRVGLRALYRRGLSVTDLAEAAPDDWHQARNPFAPPSPDNPLGVHVKSKCCRSHPRCIACPVVHRRLRAEGDYSAAAVQRARRW
ncbi:hypothetical protein [Corynebacterium frankenforstense]|uniref:hypothetical protein n=1 Tax=Corynebacterium frankenforstense TaxID=1230998 RepID=UPI000952A403|nr:hypothetical protein [Corynebacterium frankenforstense]